MIHVFVCVIDKMTCCWCCCCCCFVSCWQCGQQSMHGRYQVTIVHMTAWKIGMHIHSKYFQTIFLCDNSLQHETNLIFIFDCFSRLFHSQIISLKGKRTAGTLSYNRIIYTWVGNLSRVVHRCSIQFANKHFQVKIKLKMPNYNFLWKLRHLKRT